MRSMIMLQLCVALAVCLATAVSEVTGETDENLVNATPKSCCMPLVYEGKMKLRIGQTINDGALGIFDGHAEIYFDFPNGRFAIIEHLDVPGDYAELSYITISNITYMILPIPRTCTKIPVVLPKQKNPLNCIPETAKYLGRETLGGLGGPSLDVDIWEYPIEFAGLTINSRARVIKDKDRCVPLFNANDGTMEIPKLKQFVAITTSGLKEGITDPDIFILPDYCNVVEG